MDARLPVGELLYAVGDIHGRSDLLSDLVRRIEADAARTDATKKSLVFVGDYVDRGPDSRGVVDMLLNDLPEGFEASFLKGNHEAMLLDFVANPAQRLDHWLMNGGEATMVSYGVDVDTLLTKQADPALWHAAFMASLPESHLEFFRSLSLMFCAGDYLFVHAGLRPGVPIDAQDESDLIWIRGAFLDSSVPFGKLVVHGHTPVPEPEVRDNRIDIDTGAVFTGRLTALRLQDGKRDFLET